MAAPGVGRFLSIGARGFDALLDEVELGVGGLGQQVVDAGGSVGLHGVAGQVDHQDAVVGQQVDGLAAEEADGAEAVGRLPLEVILEDSPQVGPAIDQPLAAGGQALEPLDDPSGLMGSSSASPPEIRGVWRKPRK